MGVVPHISKPTPTPSFQKIAISHAPIHMCYSIHISQTDDDDDDDYDDDDELFLWYG